MTIIGIDFGTSNSCISVWNNRKGEVIQNEIGELTTPTVLYFGKDNEILFGEIARTIGERDPENLITNIKRLVGKSYNQLMDDKLLYNFFRNNELMDINNEIYFKIYSKLYSVSDLICIYLNYIASLKNDISGVVITVPAYFNDLQRSIIKACCEKVGLSVLRVINEPTAAALAYKDVSDKASSYVLIFDCGGGTTDLSLLYMDYEENIYEVKDVVGDNFLGGEDLTEYLYEYIKEYIIDFIKNDKYFDKDINRIKIKKGCEMVKKELSYKNESKFYVELDDKYFTKIITRHQFNEICKPFYDKIRDLIRYIIKDKYIDINNVVFVGGSTRVKYFETIFMEELKNKNLKICNSIDPDITVSVGAAIQGGLLTDINTDGLLMDVIPLSLGVEAEDGLMSIIISRNTIIPVEMKKEFLNSSDYEDSIIIKVYQGERRFVKDNYFLGEFILTHEKLKEYPKGKIIIDITFSIDTDGIITMLAEAKIKGETIKFDVKKINGKTDIVFNLGDIVSTSVMDSIMENKIIVKNELYNSFKTLLSAYHQNNIELDEYSRDTLNNMYEKVFIAIRDFKNYEIDELQSIKIEFENDWHKLIFSGDIGGSSMIKEIE